MPNYRVLALSLAVGVVGVGEATAGIWKNGPLGNGVQNNGVQNNGVQNNGVQNNGVQNNGVQNNGVQNNGVQNNGTETSGVSYNGIQIDRTRLSYIGHGTNVFGYSCSHREDVQGTALNNCSPCSMTVANADTYCRQYYWDSICVDEARSMCTLGAGTVMTATFTNGSTAQMRIDSVTQGAASFWNGSVYTNMSDVSYNRVSWVLPHAPNVTGSRLLGGMNSCTNQVCNLGGAGYGPDSYCCNNYWDGLCVAEANAQCGASTGTVAASSTAGDSVCGTSGGQPVQAIFLGGVWNQQWGAQGNGSKSASNTAFTIACRGVGAYAKCIDMGYKPWLGAQHDALHQACVRMVRADYCGDGNSFTQNGTQIDVEDHLKRSTTTTTDDLQFYGSSWAYEASWDTNGANYADHYRIQYQPSAYDGTPVNQYIGSRSAYCHIESPWSGPNNALADGVQNLLTNRTQ